MTNAECGMGHPVKQYSDFSISAEQIKQYQAMPMKKRLEWLYLGNLLRKAFHDMFDDAILKKRSRDK